MLLATTLSVWESGCPFKLVPLLGEGWSLEVELASGWLGSLDSCQWPGGAYHWGGGVISVCQNQPLQRGWGVRSPPFRGQARRSVWGAGPGGVGARGLDAWVLFLPQELLPPPPQGIFYFCSGFIFLFSFFFFLSVF